jgi:phenylacetate-CoA ligase
VKKGLLDAGFLRRVLFRFSIQSKSIGNREVRMALKLLRHGEIRGQEEMTAARNSAFCDLVRYCYEWVPYYREVMIKEGIKPHEIRGVADVVRFPILTKDDIRTAGDRIRSKVAENGTVLVRRSGGTTGEPIASRIPPLARALETYSFLRGLEWMGWEPGMKMVNLFGGSLGLKPSSTGLRGKVIASVKDLAMGNVWLPGFGISEGNAKEYITAIQGAGDCIVMGYASTLLILAKMVKRFGMDRHRVRCVFSTAEYLPETWAQSIGEAFSCSVKSYYGCGEVNSLGYQLEQGGSYVVPDEHVIVENVDKARRVKDGISDESLLITALYNRAQPLIRYASGDLGEVGELSFRGKNRTCIRTLLGRQSDIIENQDGELISPALLPHLVFVTGLPVQRYQFIQFASRDLEFRYEAEQPLSVADEEVLRNILASHLGEKLELTIVKTSEFIVTSVGKLRVIIRRSDG